MGSSGGQQPVTQQTTQTKDPWGPAQPHLQNVMNQAHDYWANTVGYQPYTGNTTASLDPYAFSFGGINQLATQEPFGSTALQNARDAGASMLQNYGLSPEMQNLYNQASTQDNPYLQGAINQQVNRANAGASGMGRYGSGAHDAAIAQAISPIMAQDYARRQQQRQDILTGGLQRQGQWAENIPTLDAARYANLSAQMGVADMQRAFNQANLDQQLKIWNAQQAQPWEMLQRYSALTQGAGGLGGTQITSSPGATQPGTLQRILGGSLAGAGLGSAVFPGIGTGIGALGGGLLGLL